MLSVWRFKFESAEKCESGWSKVQYVCDTIVLTLKDKVCYYSITHSSAFSQGSRYHFTLCYHFVFTGQSLNGTIVSNLLMDRRRNNSYYAMTPEWFGR